jgi:tetratricopeptide (TPR) repeat protein
MRSELPTLAGIGLDGSALGPGADWVQSQIVGREAEMHLLSRALEQTRIGGEPASITLLGPKGAGKTRLLEAFVDSARKLESPAVRIIKCAGREGENRYGLFARLLRDRFELRDDMTDDEVRWEVRARVSDVLGDRKVGDVLYFLGRLLDIPFRESPITRAIEHDLAEMDMVCRAVARSFFEADARRAPLCLVVEDVHLCEDESLGLLRSLVESVDAPFFVLCTARTELLGRSVAWARSGRHKLVHLAAQTHDEAAVAARIAVLSAEELSLLEGAARMGSVFWAGALIALERAAAAPPAFWDPESNEPRARRLLASLAERDYVLKLPDSSFPGDEEYIFKHSLERERILASTTPEVARHVSQIIAEWLERQPVLRDHEDNLCTLAEHRQRAGLAVAAGRAYLEAGEIARRRDAVNAAADCFAKGIALLGDEEPATRLEALRRLSSILVAQGKREAALQRFSEMAALAFRLNAPLEGAEAHVGTARLKADADDTAAALRHLRAAIGLYSQAGADDDVGHATAELDKLIDKAAAANAKRAPAAAVNGSAKTAPVVADAAAVDTTPVEAAAIAPSLASDASISEAMGETIAAADETPVSASSVSEAAVDSEVIEETAIAATSVGGIAEGLDLPISEKNLGAPDVEEAPEASEPPTAVVLEPPAELGEALVDAMQVVADAAPSVDVAPSAVFEEPPASERRMDTAETAVEAAQASGDVETPGDVPSSAESAAESATAAESADAANANANAHAGGFELVGDVPPSAVETTAEPEAAPHSSETAAADEHVPQNGPVGDAYAMGGNGASARVDAADAEAPDGASPHEETTMVGRPGEQAAAASAAEASDTAMTSSDRPTPPTPFPAVAALAAATLPSSWEEPPITRRAPAIEAGVATSPGVEPSPASLDDDAVAIDIDFSDEESSPVTDWIELKTANPATGTVVASDAPEGMPEDTSFDSDTDGAPTVRRFVAAADASAAETADPSSAETPEADGGTSDDDPETKKKNGHALG